MRSTFKTLAAVASAALMFAACVKDSAFKTYTIYKPIIKDKAEVEAGIRSEGPRTLKEAGKIYLYGSWLLVSEPYQGVHIIDNANPSSPVSKAFISIPGNQDVAMEGNTLFADCGSDIIAIDISNPLQAKVTGKINNTFPERNPFVFTGTDQWGGSMGNYDPTKMIVGWTEKDTTISQDLTETTFWQNGWLFTGRGNQVGFVLPWMTIANGITAGGDKTSTGKAGSMSRFAITGPYMYAVSRSSLHTVDISNTAQPLLRKTNAMGWNIETVYPFKDKLFIGSMTGMYIFSIANPVQPVQQGMFAHANVCDPVIADDNYAYVTLRNGTRCNGITNQMDVVNVTNPIAPSLIKSYPMTNPRGLSKDGDHIFLCDGPSGLKVLNAANNSNVTTMQTIQMAETFDVICHNKVAIVSAKDGLYQYDYTNINNIRLLSKTGFQY